MIKLFLFETRLGEWLLALIERGVGLAAVSVRALEERQAQTA